MDWIGSKVKMDEGKRRGDSWGGERMGLGRIRSGEKKRIWRREKREKGEFEQW
jgi:hypothetical protein